MKKFILFVSKKSPANIEEVVVLKDIKEMGINSITSVKVINRYVISGITKEEFQNSIFTVFAEKNIDEVKYELSKTENNRFAVASLSGQFNPREHSAQEALQLVTSTNNIVVKTAKIYELVSETITHDELNRIKKYIINPVDSEEVNVYIDANLDITTNYINISKTVETLTGFILKDDVMLNHMIKDLGLAMNLPDLKCAQEYFKEEKRDPTITEIKCLDTFWSDHCRHTTFSTIIEDIVIEDECIKDTFDLYSRIKQNISPNKPITLMNIATLAAKYLDKNGYIPDLERSEEINACSIIIDVKKEDGESEEWLLNFKNETHNHPTEIEPFGGAATCLGGAIRDPLANRTFVYQAMRITGSGDPTKSISDTIEGKLAQRYITKTATKGFSSYGNQIGVSTGLVDEIYHDGYKAKRMELGAVLGAARKSNVIREIPQPGDLVILIGGLTGNDGIGGATGSSKEHTKKSSTTCGAEVQKGNPPVERAIQRLFRNSEVTTMIKRCNDFGAGGVCVAVGELSDSLIIYLDTVPKKYKGLDGTAIAISESQERMAVVIAKENLEKFISKCNEESLLATHVADITDDGYMRMIWEGKEIVSISRKFLNSNGATRKANVYIPESNFVLDSINETNINIENTLLNRLASLSCCSRKGISQQFDSTIGAGTVLLPYGGETGDTPIQTMVCRIPTEDYDTTTCSLMSYGFDPRIGDKSPYLMGIYSVIESLSKIAAVGGDTTKVRLSFQEYFPKLHEDKERWGKVFGALLGAFKAQIELGIPAIGGKDSMSGSFENIDVPSTLVSFAVTTCEIDDVISPELKFIKSKLFLFRVQKDSNGLPDFDKLKVMYENIHEWVRDKKILSAYVVGVDGILVSLCKMSYGNGVGFNILNNEVSLFSPEVGSIIVQTKSYLFDQAEYIADVTNDSMYYIRDEMIYMRYAKKAWLNTLDSVFPVNIDEKPVMYDSFKVYDECKGVRKSIITSIQKPTVVIPVFPGTNCEYDLQKSFIKADANVKIVVINNLTKNGLQDSINRLAESIKQSQIIMLPGGFSAGDEPDGSAKYIVATFKNDKIKEATMKFLQKRDGLMLGICNGFQALIKLGLLQYGEIKDIDEDSPTLIANSSGNHISRIITTKITSNLSPWLQYCNVGDRHQIPISHGEGRFYANKKIIEELSRKGQIATLYTDNCGITGSIISNPNGSVCAIEGITSPDGKIFGKMGHTERYVKGNYLNIPGNNKEQNIFKAGVDYFKI